MEVITWYQRKTSYKANTPLTSSANKPTPILLDFGILNNFKLIRTRIGEIVNPTCIQNRAHIKFNILNNSVLNLHYIAEIIFNNKCIQQKANIFTIELNTEMNFKWSSSLTWLSVTLSKPHILIELQLVCTRAPTIHLLGGASKGMPLAGQIWDKKNGENKAEE